MGQDFWKSINRFLTKMTRKYQALCKNSDIDSQSMQTESSESIDECPPKPIIKNHKPNFPPPLLILDPSEDEEIFDEDLRIPSNNSGVKKMLTKEKLKEKKEKFRLSKQKSTKVNKSYLNNNQYGKFK